MSLLAGGDSKRIAYQLVNIGKTNRVGPRIMSIASTVAEALHRALTHPRHGIVGLVDDLLAMCQKHDLQIDWQNDHFRVRSPGGAWEELTDLSIRKSVYRAVLARIAVLCNEQNPNSVSLYGGQCQWMTSESPPTMFRILFTNTAEEQRLELTAGTVKTAAPTQMAAPSTLSQNTPVR